MKDILRSYKVVFVICCIVLGANTLLAQGEVSWAHSPTVLSDWYWMYNNQESDQPFFEPLLMPLSEVAYRDVHTYGTKIPPQDDIPYAYPLPDSFWFFWQWYVPGDTLYISPDGWVSFDESATTGYPYPPTAPTCFPIDDDPNALISVLWQNNNPTLDTGDVDNNRVYYYYDELRDNILAVEWYQVEGDASGAIYTYELILHLGGQDKLVISGACGITFSYHLIECLYHSSSEWHGDNGETGLEDQTGDYGIYYDGSIINGRKTRAGYKRVYGDNVAAAAVLSPGEMVLRYTDIEPEVVVMNIGEETESFSVMIEIYDEDLVYNFGTEVFELAPGGRDTLVAPCWTPGETGTTYEMYVYTMLARDSCRGEDTLMREIYVGCEDTLRYPWVDRDWQGVETSTDQHLLTSFSVDDGVLVTGGRGWVVGGAASGSTVLEVYSAGTGCGATSAGDLVAASTVPSVDPGWNEVEFPGTGVWVPSESQGNIWAGIRSTVDSVYLGEFAMLDFPGEDGCYAGTGPGRGGYLNPSFSWGGKSADFYTPRIELFTHLGFGDYPLPREPCQPCYVEEPHDVSCFNMDNPDQDYVEADVPVTPELAVANLGRDTEPGSGFFPVTFMAIDESTADTTFRDSHMVSHIGWLGNPSDGPDTLFVTTPPWTPEGLCDEDEPFVYYELLGLVRLGEVGPDDSDHCPDNDTVRRFVVSLLTHDVGCTDLAIDPEPDEPPDIYYPGTEITFTATVENFGFNEEHDIPVRMEVMDVDSGVLLWHNVQMVTFLNWRGNTLDEPYTIDVTFPTYTVLTDHHEVYQVRTEMDGDMCPDDDEVVHHFNQVEEVNFPEQFEFDVNMKSVSDIMIRFAVPHTGQVEIEVFDIGGRWVKSPARDTYQPGTYTVHWDGRDYSNRKVAAGIYLVRMEAGEFQAVRKLVIFQ